MAAWRNLAAVLLALVVVQTGWAQTYQLAENAQPGDCFRMRLDLTVSGDIKFNKEGKQLILRQEVSAGHAFSERVLSVAATGLPDKVARLYEKARSSTSINGEGNERQLRAERRLLVAQRQKDQTLVYSPAGTLTRDEVELTDHFDTLVLTGLLPGREVAVGETWKLPNPLVQGLCTFEGITEQTLVCKLDEVKGPVARVTVSGAVTGIDLGALVKLTVEGSYEYDLGSRRLKKLEWKQREERDQGPASPAMTLQAATTLTRTPIDRPDSLSDVALISVPEGFEPPVLLTQLEYRDARAGYSMVYARDWQTVSQSDEHLVMRLIERGDFVAQLTITPWTRAEKGKHLSPEEFHQAMTETPGWEPEQELQAGEVPAEGGRWIYRISALGQLDGTRVMQNYYLVAGPEGEQIVLVFTMTPKQADRIASRDLSLAGSIEFLSASTDPEKAKKP
jgi:hypothetical protein